MTRSWLVVFLLFAHVYDQAETSSGTEKLIEWIKENSEIFILLKHWNELPLISTSWKRLKDNNPQIIEDQRIFLEAFQSFEPLLEEQVRSKSRSAIVNPTSYIPTSISMDSSEDSLIVEEKRGVCDCVRDEDQNLITKIKVLETELNKLNETCNVLPLVNQSEIRPNQNFSTDSRNASE